METKKKQKMVLKYQYENLSEEEKIELREDFLMKSGMPYTTFYHKLRKNSFRPLEQNLFEKLLEVFKQDPIICEEHDSELTEWSKRDARQQVPVKIKRFIIIGVQNAEKYIQ